MTITEKEVITKKIVKIYHCDFCDRTSENGLRVVTCKICGRQACRLHITYYAEYHSGDTYDICVCKECDTTFSRAWYYALENAGRHDDIVEVALEEYKAMKLIGTQEVADASII